MASNSDNIWREFVAAFTCEREDWMDEAACKGKPRAWFFPGRGQSKKKGLQTCAVCPVQTECADYARRTGTEHGIWGGRILRRNERNGNELVEDDTLEPPPQRVALL